MKTSNFLSVVAGAIAFLSFVACSGDEENIGEGSSMAEEYYALLASINSSDNEFKSTDTGGTIRFAADGGVVVVYVDCGVEWTIQNSATDYFATTMDTTSITVTAVQNKVEEEVTATITFYTAANRIEFASLLVIQDAYGTPRIVVETNEWNAPAFGNVTKEIGVECNLDDYIIETSMDWITAVKSDAGVKLTVKENEEYERRDAVVTLTGSDGISTASATIAVRQDPTAYLSVATNHLSFSSIAETGNIIVEANFDVECTTTAKWLSVSVEDGVVTIGVTNNFDYDDRTAVVTLTAGDGAENVAEVTLNVSQTGVAALQLIYTLTDDALIVTLPLCGAVKCTVDWGDGSEWESIIGSFPSHTYSKSGEYCVSVTGTVTGLNSDEAGVSSNITRRTNLTAVRQWGRTGLTDLTNAFNYCENLSSIPDDTCGSFSKVASFESAFERCTSLGTLPTGLFTYAQNATDFSGCFRYCEKIVEIPAGFFDNCTSALTFASTFFSCTRLAVLPERLFANCTSCTSMGSLFRECPSLTSVPNGIFANCSKVTSFSALFEEDYSLTTIPDDLFADCVSVTSFNMAFWYCSISTVPEKLFANCPDVITFDSVFWYCARMVSVPAGLFDNNRKVTNFGEAFFCCTSLAGESPYTIVNGDKIHIYERSAANGFADVTRCQGCFYGCEKLDDYNSIPFEWIDW